MNQWSAAKIRELRLRLGWSVADFSRNFNRDLELIMSWERGDASPSLEQVRQLEYLAQQVEEVSNHLMRSSRADQIFSETHLDQIHRSRIDL